MSSTPPRWLGGDGSPIPAADGGTADRRRRRARANPDGTCRSGVRALPGRSIVVRRADRTYELSSPRGRAARGAGPTAGTRFVRAGALPGMRLPTYLRLCPDVREAGARSRRGACRINRAPPTGAGAAVPCAGGVRVAGEWLLQAALAARRVNPPVISVGGRAPACAISVYRRQAANSFRWAPGVSAPAGRPTGRSSTGPRSWQRPRAEGAASR